MGVVRGDNSLFFATALDNSALRRGSFDAVSLIQNMSSKIAAINPFAALAIGAVAAFATISAQAYTMSKNFEQAMKEVETISSATQNNFKGISQSVFELSKITPDGPEKLANAYYQIVSAGFDGAEGLKLLETAAKSAVAGVTDTLTAADGITTVLNAFKIEAENSNEVADILFKTVQLGKTTFAELAANLSTVAPIAAASNIPFQEIAAAVASLTKQGVPTAQAMTQIRSAIISTNEVLGDGWTNTLNLQEAFQLLYKEAEGSQTKLTEMVGRVEAVSAILGVAGKNADGAAKDLEAMADAAGASTDAFDRMASSNVNQIEILRNRIRATTKGIGDAVLEMSNDIAGGLNDLLEPLDSVIVGLEQERLEVLKLESTIKNSNTSSEERIRLIQELKDKYPGLLANIDAETVSNEDLTKSLRAINQQLINKIILQEKEVEINDQNVSTKERLQNVLEREKTVQEQLVKIAEKEGKTIKENATLIEQAKDLLSQFSKEERDAGGRLINPLAEFSFQINQLETAQKNLNIQEQQGVKLQEEKNKLAERLGLIIDDNNKKRDPEVDSQIAKIKAITKEQYDSNKQILKEYLESENKEIKAAAEKRKALFEFKIDPDGDKTFSDYLKAKEEQYKAYAIAIENNEIELADKLKTQYKLKQDDYVTYLRQLYSETEDIYKRIDILNALNGINLQPRKIAEAVSTIKPEPIVLDFKIDTTSINAIEREINRLEEERKAALTQSERDLLQIKIDAKRKELEIANNNVKKEEDLYQNLTRSIRDLNNKQLRDYIDYWKKKLKVAKKGSDAAAEAEGNIQNATEAIADNTVEALDKISGVLGEASSIFRKFGDEDTAQLLDQLSGVAQGAGELAKGIATNNPLDIIKGSLSILSSALTVEVVSDTAKFEAAIKELEKSIEKLDYVISKSIGQDRLTNRSKAIEDLEELERQAELAKQAELEARKEVKLLGITIGKKGEGSGTDPEKLEEIEQKAEDARRKAEELREQLDELYTGTTQSTIVDNIIAGLKEGKKSVADFADNFKDLMQDALLKAFQIKYLEKEIEKFYEAFSEAGSDSSYTVAEINALRELYDRIINGAQDDIDAINAILEDSGIDRLGSEADNTPNGLQGAIRRELTEETGSELTGLFRGYYDLSKQHFELAQKEYTLSNNIVEFSEQIANNTAQTVLELQSAIRQLELIAENTDKLYIEAIT